MISYNYIAMTNTEMTKYQNVVDYSNEQTVPANIHLTVKCINLNQFFICLVKWKLYIDKKRSISLMVKSITSLSN